MKETPKFKVEDAVELYPIPILDSKLDFYSTLFSYSDEDISGINCLLDIAEHEIKKGKKIKFIIEGIKKINHEFRYNLCGFSLYGVNFFSPAQEWMLIKSTYSKFKKLRFNMMNDFKEGDRVVVLTNEEVEKIYQEKLEGGEPFSSDDFAFFRVYGKFLDNYAGKEGIITTCYGRDVLGVDFKDGNGEQYCETCMVKPVEENKIRFNN